MTNAEKFKEVFGLTISEYAPDPCHMMTEGYCESNSVCTDCEAFKFWKKKYKEPKKKKEKYEKKL